METLEEYIASYSMVPFLYVWIGKSKSLTYIFKVTVNTIYTHLNDCSEMSLENILKCL